LITLPSGGKVLATHLVGRYGLDEVASWHFEVWNEMQGLRERGSDKSKTPPLYMQLFNASSVALKGVSPRLRVGGPATMQLFAVDDFLRNCSAQGIAVDFVHPPSAPPRTPDPCSGSGTRLRASGCGGLENPCFRTIDLSFGSL
jgi:hypothetical protein